MQAFIPRKLDDVVDFERDLYRVREGLDTDLVCGRFYVFMLLSAGVQSINWQNLYSAPQNMDGSA